MMFTIPVVINKSDIAKYAVVRGKAFSEAVTLNGKTYAPGECVFTEFIGGRHRADMLWHGNYHFRENADASVELVPFAELPPDARTGKGVNDVV
jgi:hypothetical protein